MLQSIRDAITGWLAYAVILVLIIPFALWGIGDYLGVFGDSYAVKVNDAEIPLSTYRDSYTRRYSQIRDAYGAGFRADVIDEARLRQEVLDQLVDEELLLQYATRRGLRVSDSALVQQIHAIPAFQEDGRFSAERYRTLLRASGMNTAMFERDMRRSMVLAQLEGAVVSSSFLPRRALQDLIRLSDQRREFAWIEVGTGMFVDRVEVGEEQVAEFYEANLSRFLTQETVDIEYLELSLASVADTVSVDEAAARALYEDRLRSATAQEERRASHILLTTEARSDDEAQALAESLRARIEAGESFAELAAEHSDDTETAAAGGDLGWVERGSFVRELENALYALEVDEVSAPVRTGFGWHLIRLERVRGEDSLPPFEEMRAELEREARSLEAERRFYSLVDRMADLAFENPDSLDPAAGALGISVRRINDVTRRAGPGPAGDPQVRNAAFSTEVLEHRYNSGPLELADGRVLVVRVVNHEPPRQFALAEVADIIHGELVRAEALRLARATADDLLARARAGEEMSELAEEAGANWHPVRSTGRFDEEAPPALLGVVFLAPHPDPDGEPVILSEDIGSGFAVFRLYDVAPGTPESMEEAQVVAIMQALGQRVGSAEFEALLRALRAEARISYGSNLFADDEGFF